MHYWKTEINSLFPVSLFFLMKLARHFLIAILSGFTLYYALMFVGCWIFSMPYTQLLGEMQIAAQTISNAPIIRYMLAVQTASIFLLPAVVFLRLQHIPVIERRLLREDEIKQNTIRPVFLLGAIAVLVLVNMPGVNLLSQCNTQFVQRMIDANSTMLQLYNHSEQVSEFLLNEASVKGLFFNILIIAILPAVSEELFFRGLLQQILQRTLSNIHVVIFVTALIFSLFHGDVFNIVPRLIMGMLFGYVFFLTKNVWYPIIAHCVHNATVVLMYFFIHNNYIPPHSATVGEIGNGLFAGLLSLIIVAVIMFVWWKKERNLLQCS